MNELARIVHLAETRPDERKALATLVRVLGSSYRRPGARRLICADGTAAGTLSAGCIEDEVAVHAREVLRSGESKLVAFDTRRRFGCNGSIEIFIEPVADGMLQTLRGHLGARRRCVLRTRFEGAKTELGTRVSAKFGADFTDDSFVQVVEPSIRLLVIGDGPDADALRSQGNLLGWDCELVPGIAEWRGEVDCRTAAIVATHNYGRDCAALRYLLPLELRYLGLIGPRRRRDELLADVLDSGAILKSELFAPAGLHLGADSPAEIALAITAEIQSIFASATGEQLRNRRAPIHAVTEPEDACAPSAR